MKNRLFMALLLSLVMTAQVARAGAYPDRPVEAIVPWAVGGGSDMLFRGIAQVFPKYANGQPFLIKNIPGAAGVPGTVEFMKAKPDGYTIEQWAGAQTIKTHMSKTPYTATQFVPIIGLVNDPFYILVRADSPFKTLKDYIDYAKANPGKISAGNAGSGGGVHFSQIAFEKAVGIETIQVPFQGGGPAVTGLLSGQTDVSHNIIPEGANNIKNGQLRILAVFSEKRLPAYPDAPTAKEQGVDLVLTQWRGAVAPTGTSPEVVKPIHDILKKVVEDADFLKAMNELGFNVEYLDSAGYGKILEKEDKEYLEIIKDQKLGDIYGAK